jgi:hypothetical protein
VNRRLLYSQLEGSPLRESDLRPNPALRELVEHYMTVLSMVAIPLEIK